jgi:hypothetical protein
LSASVITSMRQRLTAATTSSSLSATTIFVPLVSVRTTSG